MYDGGEWFFERDIIGRNIGGCVSVFIGSDYIFISFDAHNLYFFMEMDEKLARNYPQWGYRLCISKT